MAKIEEITALLIDEIDSFKKAIGTLKEESDKIRETTFTIDTDLLDIKFDKLMNATEEEHTEQHHKLKALEKKLNKTIIFPKWMIILFSSFFIIFLFSFSYNFYQFNSAKKIKKEAYDEGVAEVTNYMIRFFDEHPKAYATYKKWNKKE